MTARDMSEGWAADYQDTMEKIQEDGFSTNVNRQVAVLDFIAEMRTKDIVPGRRQLEESVAEAMGIGMERLGKLLELEDARDLRRALKATRRVPTSRVDGEEVYPTTGWLGEYLDYSMDSEVPLGWHFWTAVSILGAALRRNLYMDWHSFYVMPNIYSVMVGESAAHKSTAMGHGFKLMEVLNEKIFERVEDTGYEDKRVIVLPIKTTPEAMVDALAAHKKSYEHLPSSVLVKQSIGLLHCSELNVLFGKNVMGADRLVHLLTDLYGYDQKYYTFRTRQRGEHKLTEPIITCMLGSTASWINKSVTTDMFHGGFVGRNMWLERDPSTKHLWRPEPLDPIRRGALAEGILPWSMTTLKEMEPTPGAERWFKEWYLENKTTPPPIPLMESWKERKQGHLLKLAMILRVSEMCGGLELGNAEFDRCPSIDLPQQYIELALKLIDLEQERMPDCFSRIGQHESVEVTDEILVVLRHMERTQSPVLHSALFHKVRHRVGDVANFKRHIATLMEAKLVERIELSTKGWAYTTRVVKT